MSASGVACQIGDEQVQRFSAMSTFSTNFGTSSIHSLSKARGMAEAYAESFLSLLWWNR